MLGEQGPGAPVQFTSPYSTMNGDARRLLLDARTRLPSLGRLAQLAARLLGADSGQVSLFTDVQTVVGRAGPLAGAVQSTYPLDDSLCALTAADGKPLVVGDTRADGRVLGLSAVTAASVGAYLGVPLDDGTGQVVGSLCVLHAEARRWSDSDIEIMGHLAESIRAELALTSLAGDAENTQTRWELAVEAGDIGSFDWDLSTGELIWDDRLIAMYGYDSGDVAFDRTIASVEARVHPDDLDMVNGVLGGMTTVVGPFELQYRVMWPDGRIRWLEARGRSLAGTDGQPARVIGVSWDITEDQENHARAERVLSSMSVGYVAVDAQWDVSYVNDEAARILNRVNTDLVGRNVWVEFPQLTGTVFDETYRRVAASGVAESFEALYPEPLNAWFEVRAVPDGTGIGVYFLDVTERHRADDLLQLAVTVSEHMVGAVSMEDAVSALAQLVVPHLADWTLVTLVDADGRSRDVHTWHVDPAMRPVVERYSRHRLEGRGRSGATEFLGTPVPVRVAPLFVDDLLRTLVSTAAREALVELAVGSAVVVPMLDSERGIVGVLSLSRGPQRPPMSDQELALVTTMCRRAGTAIENARLHATQAARAEHDRTVAQALQEALLTRLPQSQHLDISARYRPAADGEQIGGDWYDALVHQDASTTLVIGDVVGHDIKAAATMGQLRTMLRMIALRAGDPPSTMIANLGVAARILDVKAMLTMLVARIDATSDDRRLVRWSNAGHPPPIVLHRDGRTECLRPPRPDLMLGVLADVVRQDHLYALPAGSTLLLYTDGLIETRTADIDDGIGRVQQALTRHHRLDLDDLIDHVLADTVGDRPDDDVAVLAVRAVD